MVLGCYQVDTEEYRSSGWRLNSEAFGGSSLDTDEH